MTSRPDRPTVDGPLTDEEELDRLRQHPGYTEGRMVDSRPLGHGFSYGGQQVRKSRWEALRALARYSYGAPLPAAGILGLSQNYRTQAEQAALAGAEAHNRALAMGAKWDGMDGYDFTFDEARDLPHHIGVDFGTRDFSAWVVMEWTRDAQGNLQVRNISEAELRGGRVQDCGNQYTGGQDF